MVGTPGRSGGDRSAGAFDPTLEDGGPAKPQMVAEVARKWDELLPQLHKPSLRAVDVHELKTLCELLVTKDAMAAAMLADPLDTKVTNSYLKIVDRMHKLSAVFGLNPADRKRLKQEQAQVIDAAEEWSRS